MEISNEEMFALVGKQNVEIILLKKQLAQVMREREDLAKALLPPLNRNGQEALTAEKN